MEGTDVRETLWANVSTLMEERGLNAWQLALQAHVGPASITRMKAKGSSQRLDVLERVAQFLKVPLWQLLKPPEAPPGRSAEALELADLYDAIKKPEDRERALAIARLALMGQMPAAPAPSPATPEAPPEPAPAQPPAAPKRSQLVRS